ncbi:AfsR/SARP family transcriptional regulator [Paractinoplanes globisporus]|uniref:Tetratricopeptide repeat protein n=1 Tax=Paractinoplanes globisporus TaxID=113565 RepID=A0ABW6WYB6_9ACTN|nr:tetratricopeptide repeat protein [Actinoplanes globisporus]
MHVEFRVLGDLAIDLDGRPVDAGPARQRCVLAALLTDANRPVRIDDLIGRVWDDRPPQRARSTVHTYLSRLRRTLAPAGVGIARGPGGYVLAVDRSTVDLHRFDELVRQAREAGSDAAALALWEGALALWHGDAFAGLESLWLSTVRADLDGRRLAAQLDRNDVALRLGRHGQLLAELTATADRHPLDERLAGQLMVALYRCGRQGAALTHYDRARRLLADELGVDPSPPLQEVYRRILTNELGVPSDAEPSTRTPMQLPADVSAFVGRTEELARLDAARSGAADAVVISALSGTAGVGKTSLAVHWAHRVKAMFPDGQLYMNLRGYDPQRPVSPADALAGFLYALGVRGQDVPLDADARAAMFRTELSGRRVLLVLDNASSVEQVRPLLPGTSTCLVMVTSRDSLAGLVAVHGAGRLDLDVLSYEDAVSLLRALIGDRAEADPAATNTLAGLCARLPLALRIIAEHAVSRPAVPLADLVQELTGRRPLDVLDGGDPHASVRSVFSWSYRHLAADAARAFRLFGLQPAADLEDRAVAALADADLAGARRLLDTLARAHLIQPVGAARYTMHDLLRAYAAELAAEDDDVDRRTALTRLLDHYVAAATQSAQALARTPADAAAARDWLDAERANLVSVCAFAARHGWHRHTVALAHTLADYLDSGGHNVDALSIGTAARDAAHKLGDRAAESALLCVLGHLHWILGSAERAVGEFRLSVSLCREAADRAGESDALHGLGRTYQWMGRHDEAEAYLRQALAISQEIGSPSEVFVLNALGTLYGRLGRFRPAREHLRDALASARQSGWPIAEMHTLHNLAMLVAWHGPFDEALAYAEEALNFARRLRRTADETQALTDLGIVHTRLGRLDQAAGELDQALDRCRRMGLRIEEIRAGYNLGILHERQGRLPSAAVHLERALVLYRRTGEQPGVADALHALGVVHTKAGRPELAADMHRDAIAIFQQLDHPAGEALALNGLGEALYAADQAGQSLGEHQAALAVATRIEDRHEQARAHRGIASVRLADEPTLARHHWTVALDLYIALRSPEVATVREHLARLTAKA